MRISLRGRLALWYLLAIPALVFALVFTAQQVILVSMRTAQDATLQSRADELALLISSRVDPASQDYGPAIQQVINEQLASIPLALRVSDPNGRVLAMYGDVPDRIIPALNQALLLPPEAESRLSTISSQGKLTLRVYTALARHPVTGAPLVKIQTVDNMAHIAAAQDRLWWLALLEGGIGSAVILAVGYLILRQGFRPLDRILDRVQEIGRGSLRAGLPAEPRPPELERLAASLNSMWQRLDAAFRAREAFFASVSHDLRTPLTALQGQIEVLLMDGALAPQTRQTLERMAAETSRLVRLTNNLLLNAELESAPTIALAPVNLKDVLEDVTSDVWMLADDMEISLAVDEPIWVNGDYDLLKQMLLNLAENAVKFTPPDGQLRFAAWQDGEEAIIEVSDSGAGIPAPDLPHVMEPFYRGSAPRRPGSRGSGLGLAIVKRVAELHGGQVEIRSVEGQGTTVLARLPLLAALSESATEAARQATAAR